MTARDQALTMLRAVARKDADSRIVHQFAVDPGRTQRMGVEAAGLESIERLTDFCNQHRLARLL